MVFDGDGGVWCVGGGGSLVCWWCDGAGGVCWCDEWCGVFCVPHSTPKHLLG